MTEGSREGYAGGRTGSYGSKMSLTAQRFGVSSSVYGGYHVNIRAVTVKEMRSPI